MHEFSVARSLLREVERIVSAEAPACRVIEVRVQVGEFSGVDPDLLESAFGELAPASSACGARLLVHRLPLRATCADCGRTFGVVDFRFECSACASREVAIVSGDELLLDAVTMEAKP